MDQTVINPPNLDVELSDSIFRSLHLLTKWKKPSDEFMQVFSKDMFIKSNPNAFIHISHYLFTMLNPKEFKKRFYWPLHKSFESKYRNSAIDYLNHLKDKFGLSYDTVKSHIVVLPGGIKFMKVLFEIVNLVVKEEIKKIGESTETQKPITFGEMAAKRKDIQHLYEDNLKYKDLLIKNTAKIKQATQTLSNEIKHLIDDLLKECNLKYLVNVWNMRIEQSIAEEIEPGFQKINRLSIFVKEMNRLCEYLIETRMTNAIECKEDKIQDCLIKLNLEIEEPPTLKILHNNQINFANLFYIFELVLPSISDIVENFRYRSSESFEYESEYLYKLLSKSQSIQCQLNRLELSTQNDLFTANAIFEEDNSINLPNNAIMATPSICATYSSANIKQRILPQRLKLDGPSGPFYTRDSVQSSSRKNPTKSSSHDITVKITTTTDILKIFESSRKTKKSKHQLPISQITKYQDLSFSINHSAMTPLNPPTNASTPLNEFNIQQEENRHLSIYCSPLSGKNNQKLREDRYTTTPVRGSSDIQHLKKITPNNNQLKRLSVETSPSGRLEGFLKTKFNSNNHEQRKGKQNEFTPLEKEYQFNFSNNEEIENDPNINNKFQNSFKNKDDRDDLLLDTSDTILHDSD